MKDRFMNGFIAGIIGGSFAVIGGIISKALGLSELNAADFTALLLFGREIMMLSEYIWASISSIVFAAVFGIIFAHVLLIIKDKYLMIKGVIYGFVAWFLWYSLILNTFVGIVNVITLSTSLSNSLNAMIYGLVLSVVYRYLHKREIFGFHAEAQSKKIKLKRAIVTSKNYIGTRKEDSELHQSHKTSILRKTINIILRRKKYT